MKASDLPPTLSRFTILQTIALTTVGLIIAATARAEDKPAGPSLKESLDVYADVTGRTILRSGTIVKASDFLSAPLPSDTNTAASFIEGEAAKLGIEIVPDGEVFARVFPKDWEDSATRRYLNGLQAPPHTPIEPGSTAIGVGAISFKGADLNQVFQVYADLRNRTLLYPGGLGSAPYWLTTRQALSKEEVGYALNVLFAMSGIAAVDDGEAFVQLVPISFVEVPISVLGHVQTAAPPHDVAATKALDAIQAGDIMFNGADVYQFLDLYADLCNRTLLYSAHLSGPPMRLRTQQTLSKQEVIYAMNTVLRLDGIAAVNDGDRFAQLVFVTEANRVQTNAPAVNSGETSMEPTQIPRFVPGLRQPISEPGAQQALPGTSAQLVTYYSMISASGAETVLSSDAASAPVFFKAATPLTKPEVLYAIEKTLELSGLQMVHVHDKTIRIQRIATPTKPR